MRFRECDVIRRVVITREVVVAAADAGAGNEPSRSPLKSIQLPRTNMRSREENMWSRRTSYWPRSRACAGVDE